MSKNPDERDQNFAELRGDLARWTDPERVRAILGTEADAARSFRPPPPELVEDDLRLLDRPESGSQDGLSLRDLGGAEPSNAPRHQAPMPPLPAVVRSTPARDLHQNARDIDEVDDSRWLVQFAIIAAILGVLAIILITVFRHV